MIGAARRHIRQAAWSRFKPLGFTPPQVGILAVLADEAPLSSTALAEHVCMDTPTVSRVLRQLVKRGLVEMKPDPEDRRCDRLQLTAKGQKLHERLRPALEELRAGIARGLSADDRRTLAALLQKVIENANAVDSGRRVRA